MLLLYTVYPVRMNQWVKRRFFCVWARAPFGFEHLSNVAILNAQPHYIGSTKNTFRGKKALIIHQWDFRQVKGEIPMTGDI